MFSSESLWAQSFPKEPFQNGECVRAQLCVLQAKSENFKRRLKRAFSLWEKGEKVGWVEKPVWKNVV